ncbi:MAG: ATP-binding protein [Treponema sp.]|nr:ATP-binding protein [Treponema sp.]
MSKIEAGKLELMPVQYDIASLIHDTVKLNIMRYESKPIDFKLTVSENVPSALLGDELRIKQILNNLLSNAFKYTQEGQVELMLSADKKKGSTAVVLIIRVSDTGQGMTSEQVKKLGDKFSRFNMEANRKTEGTGLGMNITRNLINMMNGDIYIESTPGMGSVFTVNLPQKCINSDPIGRDLAENLMKLNLKNTTKMRNAQITQEFMPYGRVLVVDDVETNLYVARGLLAPYGISIDTAISGFEAIDKIRDGASYDIIFMDHMMPRMDGIEASKIIRSLGYSFPIVALTANALAGQAEMFLSNGFDDFISKPIDIRQLNNVLNKMIRDRQTPEVLDEARRQKNNLYAAGDHNIAIDPQLAEFFVRDAKKAINILTAIYDNNGRRSDDISTFIINVHAMKSALANVGESELSNKAAELEQAGRDQNINLILSSLPDFMESLNQVIEKLKAPEVDEADEDESNAINAEDQAYLQEKLMAIQAACASFDKKTAKEALAAIKQKSWAKVTRDQLSAIAEHLLHSEFDEAAAIAREVYFT